MLQTHPGYEQLSSKNAVWFSGHVLTYFIEGIYTKSIKIHQNTFQYISNIFANYLYNNILIVIDTISLFITGKYGVSQNSQRPIESIWCTPWKARRRFALTDSGLSGDTGAPTDHSNCRLLHRYISKKTFSQ